MNVYDTTTGAQFLCRNFRTNKLKVRICYKKSEGGKMPYSVA